MRFGLETVDPIVRLWTAYVRNWNSRVLLFKDRIPITKGNKQRSESILNKLLTKLKRENIYDYEGIIEASFNCFPCPFLNQILNDKVIARYRLWLDHRLMILNRSINHKLRMIQKSFYSDLNDFVNDPIILGYILLNRRKYLRNYMIKEDQLISSVKSYLKWPFGYENLADKNKFFDKLLFVVDNEFRRSCNRSGINLSIMSFMCLPGMKVSSRSQ
jgi:hypothetical protein